MAKRKNFVIRENSQSMTITLICVRLSHAQPESFVRGGSNFDSVYFNFIFLVDEGKKDSNTTISGSSSAHQRSAIWMAFRWRVDDGPSLNADLVAL